MGDSAGTAIEADDFRLIIAEPRRLTLSPAWHGHIPFAFLAVRLVEPRTLVELGVAGGDSYCSFCQAVDTLGLKAECYGIDTWLGDPQSGPPEEGALEALRSHHDPLYGHFSRLVQSTFADALARFGDGSIDLLHIDGYHTYEAVRGDFEAWRPKLSDRAVVLLYDTAVRTFDFGVWRLWEEIADGYPSFAFEHSHGLGVLAVGPKVNGGFLELLGGLASDGVTAPLLAALGNRLVTRSERSALEAACADLAAARDAVERERDEQAAAAQLKTSRLRAAIEAERAAVEAERAGRLAAEYYITALESTRTLRYTASARAAYGRVRRKDG